MGPFPRVQLTSRKPIMFRHSRSFYVIFTIADWEVLLDMDRRLSVRCRIRIMFCSWWMWRRAIPRTTHSNRCRMLSIQYGAWFNLVLLQYTLCTWTGFTFRNVVNFVECDRNAAWTSLKTFRGFGAGCMYLARLWTTIRVVGRTISVFSRADITANTGHLTADLRPNGFKCRNCAGDNEDEDFGPILRCQALASALLNDVFRQRSRTYMYQIDIGPHA